MDSGPGGGRGAPGFLFFRSRGGLEHHGALRLRTLMPAAADGQGEVAEGLVVDDPLADGFFHDLPGSQDVHRGSHPLRPSTVSKREAKGAVSQERKLARRDSGLLLMRSAPCGGRRRRDGMPRRRERSPARKECASAASTANGSAFNGRPVSRITSRPAHRHAERARCSGLVQRRPLPYSAPRAAESVAHLFRADAAKLCGESIEPQFDQRYAFSHERRFHADKNNASPDGRASDHLGPNLLARPWGMIPP
jgi:hypothetical protein